MAISKPTREEIAALTNAKGELPLRVVPGSKIEKIAIENGGLKIWLRNAPENGKANKAMLAILAGLLDVPVGALVLVRGETSRDKRVQMPPN